MHQVGDTRGKGERDKKTEMMVPTTTGARGQPAAPRAAGGGGAGAPAGPVGWPRRARLPRRARPGDGGGICAAGGHRRGAPWAGGVARRAGGWAGGRGTARAGSDPCVATDGKRRALLWPTPLPTMDGERTWMTVFSPTFLYVWQLIICPQRLEGRCQVARGRAVKNRVYNVWAPKKKTRLMAADPSLPLQRESKRIELPCFSTGRPTAT